MEAQNTIENQDLHVVSKAGVVLTKHNLCKPNWKGNKMSVFLLTSRIHTTLIF
jgi:hypothetical protein